MIVLVVIAAQQVVVPIFDSSCNFCRTKCVGVIAQGGTLAIEKAALAPSAVCFGAAISSGFYLTWFVVSRASFAERWNVGIIPASKSSSDGNLSAMMYNKKGVCNVVRDSNDCWLGAVMHLGGWEIFWPSSGTSCGWISISGRGQLCLAINNSFDTVANAIAFSIRPFQDTWNCRYYSRVIYGQRAANTKRRGDVTIGIASSLSRTNLPRLCRTPTKLSRRSSRP